MWWLYLHSQNNLPGRGFLNYILEFRIAYRLLTYHSGSGNPRETHLFCYFIVSNTMLIFKVSQLF